MAERETYRSMDSDEHRIFSRVRSGEHSLLDEAAKIMISRGAIDISSPSLRVREYEAYACDLEELPKHLSRGNTLEKEIARRRLEAFDD